jgi:hypothetical protein
MLTNNYLKSFFAPVFFFCLENSWAQQTYSFSGWAAGNFTYTKIISVPVSNTMTVTYTESANNRANTLVTDNSGPCFGTNSLATAVPFYYNSKWPSTAWEDYSTNGCYCYSVTGFSSGLTLTANYSSNAATNYEQVVIQFASSVSAPLQFSIWNINQGSAGSPYPFTDNVDISALDAMGASVPAADITIGNSCGNMVATAGNTKIITGVKNNCISCANNGSGSNAVSIGIVGTYISRITLKYYSTPANTQANPSSQYIIITDITSPNNAILPISLLSFTGRCDGYNKIFEWTTASEINNDFFTVEKSKNGIDFSELGKIEGAGNSSSLKNYKAEFPEKDLDYKYYRLRQTDFNGKFSFSGVIYLSCIPDYYGDVLLYPNPSSGYTNIRFNTAVDEKIMYSLTDVFGREVKRGEFIHVTKGDVIAMDTGDLPAGIYLIKINEADNKISFPILKLIKEK